MISVIKNATIVTQNAQRKILPTASIVVEDGIIKKISTRNIPKRAFEKEIDASGYILFPGFINAHVHLGESIYKSFLPQNLSLQGYLKATENIVKKSPLIENSRGVVNNYSLMLLLKSGTTTVCGGRTMETGESFGLRNISGFMIMRSYKLGKYYDQLEFQFAKEYLLACRSKFSKHAIFVHSLNRVDLKKLREIRNVLNKFPDTKLIIHLSETKHDEQKVKQKLGESSTRVLSKHNLLNKNTIAVHCNYVDNRDFELIKKSGATIVHCLSSNLRVDDTTLEIEKVLAKNIPICLGTDGLATSNSLDILAEAKLVYLYHNRFGSRKVTHQKVFDMITIDAAEALGVSQEIGSVEVGKKADLVFIRKDHPLVEESDPIKSIIFYAQSSMISGVMINGELKIWNGKFAKEKKLAKDFSELQEKIRKQIERKPLTF